LVAVPAFLGGEYNGGGDVVRILLTSILCKSGLMTHVLDLVRALGTRHVEVGLAFRTKNLKERLDYQEWLAGLGESPVFYYTTTDDLALLYRRYQPQLIHAHSPNCFHCSASVSMRYGLPLIITLHSTFPVEKWCPLTALVARWIIAVGPAQARVVPSFQNKTVIIPNGIDLERFRPKKHLFRRRLRLCWFGRVHGEMAAGVEGLNRALALVRAQGARLDAHFLGSAPQIPKDQFIDLGWLDDPVPSLQRSQIAFGHGRALREAMACGNIGFLVGAGYGGQVTGELLHSFQHLDAFPEYRLPKASPELLAADILELLDNPQSMAGFQKEARQIALEHFGLRAMVDATLNLYEQALYGRTG
jgi:glycosyltransferase involved in cell wall biosynthesis